MTRHERDDLAAQLDAALWAVGLVLLGVAIGVALVSLALAQAAQGRAGF